MNSGARPSRCRTSERSEGDAGTPIIPYGTSAILSVGRAGPRPVVRGDTIVIARQFPLSLSYDHRIIDGAEGRRFLAAVIEALEG